MSKLHIHETYPIKFKSPENSEDSLVAGTGLRRCVSLHHRGPWSRDSQRKAELASQVRFSFFLSALRASTQRPEKTKTEAFASAFPW